MKKAGLVKLGALLAVVLLLGACGSSLKPNNEKIAVVEWTRLQEAHPDYTKLQQGEKVLKDLLTKRETQEKLAQSQMTSLNRLRALRQASEQSFLEADFNTRMVEQREIENAKLQRISQQVAAEVDAELGPHRKEVEDSYQLRIFNLRAKLEMVRLRPEEKAKLEAQLEQLQHERGFKVGELNAQRQAIIDAKMQPFLEEAQQHMAETAEKYQTQMAAQLADKVEKDKAILVDAPQALSKALAIMDREIEKQQEKNDSLKKKINADIESRVIQEAKENGYTIVFNQYKVNVKATDITDAVSVKLRAQ